MWRVTETQTMTNGTQYIIQNTGNGGYLANNGEGGGAIHFAVRHQADAVADMLNNSYVH